MRQFKTSPADLPFDAESDIKSGEIAKNAAQKCCSKSVTSH
jgi:hypothetical protein